MIEMEMRKEKKDGKRNKTKCAQILLAKCKQGR